MAKWIFVTGGMSGLGKGLVTASTALILQDLGFKVSVCKIDPYFNVDAGTMSPYEHGEVFVTEDGYEADQDLGLFERFLNKNLSAAHSITSGQIYLSVIQKERQGHYLGKTVQLIPHVTQEIIDRLTTLAKTEEADFVVVEIGGTVGDLESAIFLEAARILSLKQKTCFIHVSYVPTLTLKEQKTKLTQQSVRLLRETGIKPDFIFSRSAKPLTKASREKIALFCSVKPEQVISAYDVKDVYSIPFVFINQDFDKQLLSFFGLPQRKAKLTEWKLLFQRKEQAKQKVNIALIGKYSKLKDAYISIEEALKHCECHLGVKVQLDWIEAEQIRKVRLERYDGIIVPGGFGMRGTKEKIEAIKWAREHNVPFLGLCLGFQLAVIEFARNVLGLKDADSEEFSKTRNPVIKMLPDQDLRKLGGTMRLGNYECTLKPKSLAHKIYKSEKISERHRHRYEFNNSYKQAIEQAGGCFSGFYKKNDLELMEIFELPEKDFFIATQFHPEFSSRLERPSPIFMEFVRACSKFKAKKGLTLFDRKALKA